MLFKKNKRFNENFLETFILFLKQGYAMDEVLDILSSLNYHKEVNHVFEQLMSGEKIDDILLSMYRYSPISTYFSFFKNTFTLVDALEKSMSMKKSKDEMINGLKKTLTYPLCLLVITMIFCIFVVAFLMPQIDLLFVSFEIQQTLMHHLVFGLFRLIPLLFCVSIILMLMLFFYAYDAMKKQKYQNLNQVMHHFRLVSTVVRKYYSLKFAQYFNELTLHGYDLTSIIEILYNDIEDKDVRFVVYEIYQELSSGTSLLDAIRAFPYFEEDFKLFFYMMCKSNQSKSLNHYLDFSMIQIRAFLSRMTSILIPSIYMFVGGFVVTVYLSIITPMMNIITTI